MERNSPAYAIHEELNNIWDAINDKRYTHAREIIAEMELILGANNSHLVQARRLIEFLTIGED